MGGYSNGQQITYKFAAAALSSATIVGRFIGPAGKTGRVVSAEALITTTTTTNPTLVLIGNSGDPNAYLTLTVAAHAANLGDNANARGVDNRIDADTVVEVAVDGGADAGAADLTITVEWS
ncbi:MAG: hypothetical protein IIC09_04175 [Proteobacteria bacterium]|nr:hypothetical protein [Pseudomonadota bacterium]